jgi:hypothetical protein
MPADDVQQVGSDNRIGIYDNDGTYVSLADEVLFNKEAKRISFASKEFVVSFEYCGTVFAGDLGRTIRAVISDNDDFTQIGRILALLDALNRPLYKLLFIMRGYNDNQSDPRIALERRGDSLSSD